MKLIVNKTGATLYSGTEAGSSGEGGETEGLLRHLVKDHEVIYLGRVKGVLPEGVVHADIDLEDVDQWTGGDEIAERCKPAIEICRDADAFISNAGYASTRFWPDNPNGTMCQACGVRYMAPPLYVVAQLAIPTFAIINDPRNYPQYQEMVDMWPVLQPKAMLSQRTRTWRKRICGHRFTLREVYAAAETWFEKPRYDLEKDIEIGCVAHAHGTTGIRVGHERIDEFMRMIEPLGDRIRVYGDGWPKDDPRFPGKLKQKEANELLARSKFCPIMSHEPGFYTGKLKTVVSQNCIPLLWSEGKYAYDPDHRYLAPDHPYRITDIARQVDKLDASHVVGIQEAVKADFSLLDQMLHDDWIFDDEWFTKYGGYIP